MNQTFEEKLGYTFRDASLLRLALTHPTARYERDLSDDNQRLEYLGDAALGLAVAEHLYRHRPDLDEGRLTVLRSRLASTAALAGIARRIELGAHLDLGRGEELGGGRDKNRTLADALESVLGAAYLDGGIHAVAAIVERNFLHLLEEAAAGNDSENHKGVLQEWAQKAGLPCPTYQLLSMSGPAHQPTFTIKVTINDELYAEAEGPSKRAAEQVAALLLLTKVRVN